jgi:hypothetical protein
MNPGVALIIKPKLDLAILLPLARQLLGYSLAKTADGTTIPLSDLAHQLACIAAFKDEKAPATVRYARPYLGLFTAGFIVAADERDMLEILEAARGMESVVTETIQRGVSATIISGTLDQWQRAIKLACQTSASLAVRQAYNAMYRQFVDEGLRSMFDNLRTSDQSDNTFLLLEG